MTTNCSVNEDIQSWWEVPSIAHFCSLFRVAFNLLDFDIEELEEALLTDGTELNGNSLLTDLIVRLLCGCLGHNGISAFNYQMFLRRLFRTKCKEQGRENPFNTDVDFQFLPLRTKVEILHALCDFRLDADDVIDVLKNLDSDSLRVHPLGHDEQRSAYWYFYGTRLYKEEYPKKRKKKKEIDKLKKKRKDTGSSSSEDEFEQRPTGSWKVMCYTEGDWRDLTRSLANSTCREERALYSVLSEDFLPEIPRLFEEKERLQRKRAAEQAPRRSSRRLARQEEASRDRAHRSDVSRERAHRSDSRGTRQSRYSSRFQTDSDGGSSLSERALTPVQPGGRQTNNSLSSVTGEIFIQSSSRRKIKSPQLFRRTREDLMTGMYKVLDRVKAHKDAWPFLEPVDEDHAPKYYSVIAKPMDLQTMEDKLDNGEYGSMQQFRSDFQLIVDNCRQYNGSDNQFTGMVRRLQEAFETYIHRYLEAEDVSDEDVPPLLPREDQFSSDTSMSLNRPRSRSTSPESSLDSEAKDAMFIKREVKEESFLNRDNKVDKTRLRRKQKRRKKSEFLSDDSDSGESSDEMLRQKQRTNDRREMSIDRLDMRTSSSRDTSKDRSKISKTFNDRSRARVRVKRKGVPKKDRAKDKLSSDSSGGCSDRDGELKERLFGSSRETSKERSRARVNYKEVDSTDDSDDMFTDTSDDSHFESKLKEKASPRKTVKKAGVIKDVEQLLAVEIATDEVLKDINRWLDEAPRFSDFSSCSNSPLHMPSYEDMATLEGEYRRRLMLDRPVRPRDRYSNELHRRRMFKEQMGLKRRREIQRTIDRLQPGKSKGNLLSKDREQQNQVDAAGAESKSQANENDENAPKISLGKVLASDILSFGIGESAKKDSEDERETEEKVIITNIEETKEEKQKEEAEIKESKPEVEEKTEKKEPEKPPVQKKEKPTPNLSAWFKAFGAPKAQPPAKKKPEAEENKGKDEEDEEKRIGLGIQSPARRQRKASTGSSVSERSSFSIEPGDGNSPRIHDEPYVSPQQEMKTYHHSPINGTIIKVGFYQDTCFPRGTSEKSSSPRDPTGCSPRDLPSVSPRTGAFSPRHYPNASPRSPPMPYCSPRHATLSPRHAPLSPRHAPLSPRHAPLSPRHAPLSPRHAPLSPSPQYIGSPRHLPPNASPRDYPNSPLVAHHEYPDASPRNCTSPKEPVPLSPYASPHPYSTPIYPHYPPPLAAHYESNKILEYRSNEKAYPVKKRAYSEIDNSSSKGNDPPPYKSGGSFTPTREAMEQERTFTPTPGRMPGPSRVASPLPMPIAHSLHYDPYADERRIASPFYSGPSSPRPIYPQPTSVIPPNYRHEPNMREEREAFSSRPTTPSYAASPQPEVQRSKTPLMAYSSRPTTPAHNISPSSTPINYSSTNTEVSNKERSPSPIVNRSDGLPNSPQIPYNNASDLSDLSIRKVNPPTSPVAPYPGSRYNEPIPPKVASPYNRPITDLPPHSLNYPGQDLSKISVPLSYSNQSELLAGKMNYNHPMADLMQGPARYNYPMPELIQGKAPTVYNHPMQDFMQGKAAPGYPNINLANYTNRPISEIVQSKMNEMQAREMAAYSQRSVATTKADPPPPPKAAKKSRKKKSEPPTPSSFQQYVASTSEPISLKTTTTNVVPGSAFNFGPQLKESYNQYLDDIRSSYFAASHQEGGSGKTAAHTPPYFLGHGTPRGPPGYPHHPFMNAQYQQYLQRHPEELLRPMMLHQGLLPHTAGYPHAYLGMHDAINRPSWL